MADILEFNTKNMTENQQEVTSTKEILQEILKEADKITDLVIFIKDIEDNRTMFHTNPSLEDKSVFIQLLQHDIYNDLEPAEEIYFDPDV